MTGDLKLPVALFGGTFDPIHLGHLGVAEAALAAQAAGSVIFIPARIPPHKRDRQLSGSTHRMRMVELAIAGTPAFSVSSWELERDSIS